MKIKNLTFSVFLFLMFSFSAFADEQKSMRAQNLFRDIRCATCQSQTIESSNAQVAQDMRAFIVKRIEEGVDDLSIRSELRAAYGDGIFLTPPLQRNTYFLWAFPALVLFLGLIILGRHFKKGAQA